MESRELKSFIVSALLVLVAGVVFIWVASEIGDAIINFKMVMSK